MSVFSNGITSGIGTSFPTDANGNIIANIIPRTGLLASLQSLTNATNPGELASATDTPAIVQINASSAATYSPMSIGTWNDTTKVMTLSSITAVSSGLGFFALNGSGVTGGPINFQAGTSTGSGGVGASGGGIAVSAGHQNNTTASGAVFGGAITLTAGNNLTTGAASNGGGNINISAGNSFSSGVSAFGGSITLLPGNNSTGFALDGVVALSNSLGDNVIITGRAGASASGLAFFDKAVGSTLAAQPVSYGTPTNVSKTSSITGTAATLAQVGGTLAALITDLKTLGLIGA